MFCSRVGEFFLSKVDVANFCCKCQFYSYRTDFSFQDTWIAKLKEIQKQREKNSPAIKMEGKKIYNVVSVNVSK